MQPSTPQMRCVALWAPVDAERRHQKTENQRRAKLYEPGNRDQCFEKIYNSLLQNNIKIAKQKRHTKWNETQLRSRQANRVS